MVGINHYRGRMMRLGMIILVIVHFDDFGDGGFLIILVMVDFYEVFDDILKI